ncbi:MAG TPA: 5-dehydro-4-deoxy-D-glucuronate isomerase [Cyclobacteriaceae bacterium]|nr:5-dehydro-4-deoxy-D-glucuronate isomerase [Cyclobacteriaceae bacterium]
MNLLFNTRYAEHPLEVKKHDTKQLRDSFLISNLFIPDQVSLTYSHYDRLIVGGVKPVTQAVVLETFISLKSEFFLQRREIGIINVGAQGKVVADGIEYTLDTKETLYLGSGIKNVSFHKTGAEPPLFYFNSAPAHKHYPSRKVTLQEAETSDLGTLENANQRTIRKVLVNSVVPTCQLQMGITELKKGSIWNTLPPHTHDRRMEAYFYFELPENQAVCHFMGQPDETRHIWVKNHEAVISPPWSIHSGAGTSNYTFIWGMAGENLDYGDMDVVKLPDLR